jgi:hypothetical protein
MERNCIHRAYCGIGALLTRVTLHIGKNLEQISKFLGVCVDSVRYRIDNDYSLYILQLFKIFLTGAAIYTAFVVARSTGRW